MVENLCTCLLGEMVRGSSERISVQHRPFFSRDDSWRRLLLDLVECSCRRATEGMVLGDQAENLCPVV